MAKPALAENEEFSVGLGEIDDMPVPSGKKSKYVTIHVDEEQGQPNFIPVGVNGKIYQIQRGVDVAVPPEVVHVLQNCVAHRTVQTTHPVTGLIESKEVAFCPIPWRVVYIPK